MTIKAVGSNRSHWAAWVAVATMLVYFVRTGIVGLDFGRHWDEPVLLNEYRYAIEHRLLLPTGISNKDSPALEGGNYEYPSFLFWVGMLTALPEIIARGLYSSHPADVITSHMFSQRLRCTCLLISSLGIVWTFLAARRVVRRESAAVISACLIAGSWEIAYHARYIATDAILMQFASLCLAFCLWAAVGGSRRTAFLAAVFAGLATGTKYPGGLLFVPVLIAGWSHRPPGRSLRTTAQWLSKLFAIQIITFLLVTPGAVLQPWNFISWLEYNRQHYGVVGHLANTIRNPLAHSMAIFEYLSLVLFSRMPLFSLGLFLITVTGAVRVWWMGLRYAAILLIFPLIYAGYFAFQVVMLVRNLLILAPFLAVLAAIGIDGLFDWLRQAPRSLKGVGTLSVCGVVALMIGYNFQQLSFTADSITTMRSRSAQLGVARNYLSENPQLRVYPTEVVAAALRLPLVPTTGREPVVLAFVREDGNVSAWPANLPEMARKVWGPGEVNINYYPNWSEDRLVLLDLSQARRVPVSQIDRVVRRYELTQTLSAGFSLGPCVDASLPVDRVFRVILKRDPLQGPAMWIDDPTAVVAPDASHMWTGSPDITFEVDGLDPSKPYRIGWSWWDFDHKIRREQVRAESVDGLHSVAIQPPSEIPPWPFETTKQPWCWPPLKTSTVFSYRQVILPNSVYQDGRCRITFSPVAGPNAVVTGVWLYLPTR